jgi:hypothetical protein
MNSYCYFYGCNVEHSSNGLGDCVNCGAHFVLHRCSHYNGLSGFESLEKWLPLLTPLISGACPECRAVINLAEEVKQIHGVPRWIKELADNAEKIALAVGIAAFVVLLASPKLRS